MNLELSKYVDWTKYIKLDEVNELTGKAGITVTQEHMNIVDSYAIIIAGVALILGLFMFICYWKIFCNAREHGWAMLIPIYNLIVLSKVAFGHGAMFLLLLIPGINIIMSIIMCFTLPKAFGRSIGFRFGVLLLPIIFIPVLAFGEKSDYKR